MQKQFIIDDIININVIVIVFVFIILLISLFIYRLKFLSDHSAIIFTILHDLFENVPISKKNDDWLSFDQDTFHVDGFGIFIHHKISKKL